jgi:hypothetical protein
MKWTNNSIMSAKSHLNELLQGLGKRSAYFSYAAIRVAIERDNVVLADSTLKQYLNEAQKKRIIFDAGRGWYSGLSEPLRLDKKPVAKLSKELEKAFPLLDFTVWATTQLNPWMHHLLAQPVAFVSVPKDALVSVGEHLEERGWDVLVDPSPKEGSKRLRPGEKMVVLRERLQRCPEPDGKLASPEQVLVDLLVESSHLPIMDPHEALGVSDRVLDDHLLQVAALQRYAASRSVQTTFGRLTK